jgi:glycosyltransferase involved in cell wall biosynthesis
LRSFDTIVLFIEGSGPEGGAERIGFSTAELLLKEGFKVHIISTEKDLWPQYHNIPNLTFKCLDIPLVWDRWFSSGRKNMLMSLFTDPEMGAIISKEIKEFDKTKTICHFHSHYASFTQDAVRACIEADFRTTITCHDYGFVCPTAVLFDYSNNSLCSEVPLSWGCFNRKCLGEDGHRLKQFRFLRTLSKHKIDRTFLKLKKVIAVSKFEKEIIRNYIDRSIKIEVVENPVDPAATIRQPAEKSNHLLWTGRMTHEKDPVTAATAAKATGMPIRFAGSGRFVDAVKTANPDAILLGWQDTNRVSEEQRSARALLMTSTWYETASLVVLESLAAGIPCIIPNVNAATSWVEHGHNGLYFEAGNAKSLAECIEVIKDDTACERLSRNAYQRYWHDPFTSERYIAKLLEVYESL